jgi:hypothetical protein
VESNPRPPREPVRISAADPLAALHAWIAEGQVDEAARARARQRWLERQAAEEATLAGVLVDLAERGRPVLVTTRGGHRLSGPVRAVGADFGVVRETRLGDVVFPIDRIGSIRAAPGDGLPAGTTPVTFGLTFGAGVTELAADRPHVVVSAAGETHRGTLASAGADVITVLLDAARRETVHVATSAIDHLVITAR